MSITIDEMHTEVVAEPPAHLAGATASPPAERDEEPARMRFVLAMAVRLEQRLSAEGFDD